METKFTPGPWTMDEVRTDSGRAFRMGIDEMLRAGKGCCIIYDDYGFGLNERKANARLIAAAPELYEALEYIADLFKDRAGDPSTETGWANEECREVWEQAHAALAKARGETA